MGLHSTVILYEWPPVNNYQQNYLQSLQEALLKLPNTQPLAINWIQISNIDFDDILYSDVESGSEASFI